jgi:hypothetical protein
MASKEEKPIMVLTQKKEEGCGAQNHLQLKIFSLSSFAILIMILSRKRASHPSIHQYYAKVEGR